MKTKVALSTMALAAFFMVACGNDDNEPINDGRVYFSSNVTPTDTRVGGDNGDEWAVNDPVGVFMVANGTINVVESKANILYAVNSIANKVASFTSSTPIYYPVSGDAVDFIAYHPRQASLTNTYTYNVNVGTQTSQTGIDFMVAKANNSGNGYTKAQGSTAVALTFTHQLAKVIINVNKDESVTDAELATLTAISITGMNTTATFDLSAATPSLAGPGNKATITPLKKTGEQTYEAILLPVTLANTHIVEFGTSDAGTNPATANTYKWVMTNNTLAAGGAVTALEAGKKYIFNVTLSKTAVTATGTITAWGNGGTATGIAD